MAEGTIAITGTEYDRAIAEAGAGGRGAAEARYAPLVAAVRALVGDDRTGWVYNDDIGMYECPWCAGIGEDDGGASPAHMADCPLIAVRDALALALAQAEGEG